MKTNWEIKKLGDICDVKTGKKDVNQRNPNGKYPFFTCAREHTYSDVYSFDTEALLIAGNGDVGHVSYYNGKFEAYQRTYVLSNFKGVSAHYMFLFLNGFLKDTVSKQKLGNTMPYIKMGMLTEFSVPVPSLAEQKRIVQKLDEVFYGLAEVRKKAERNLRNAKELFESHLQSVFENPEKDWEEKTLEQVCDITSKLIDPRKNEYLDLIHVGAGNIEAGNAKLVNLKTSKTEKLISGKFLFDNKMVLYSKIRPYLIKIVRPDFSGLCSADIYPLLPKENILDKDFLYYILFSKPFTEFAVKGSARAGMPKVNREHLFSYTFYVPPVKEQNTIVKKLDALSEKTKKLEAVFRNKIADVDELKKSVLQKAFAGEL